MFERLLKSHSGPDFSDLPTTFGSGLGVGLIFAVLGVACALAPTVVDVPLPLFLLAGGLLVLIGIAETGNREVVTIDRDMIRMEYRGPFGGQSWHEPVSSFNAVGLFEPTANANIHYSVVLIHPDRNKWITLIACIREDHARSLWKDAAAVLNLPAMETSPT